MPLTGSECTDKPFNSVEVEYCIFKHSPWCFIALEKHNFGSYGFLIWSSPK